MKRSPVEVADSLERDFDRLVAAAEAVGPEALVGEWRVKQIVAHVAGWDREMLAALKNVLAGREVQYANWDVDEYNRAVALRTQAEPWKSIRAEAVAAHDALVRRVRALRGNEWERSSTGSWADGSPMTPASVLAYTYKGASHYGGHAQELEDLRSR